MNSARCDLHAHTTASDGSYTPAELIQYARAKGAAAVAVTDHDTVDGLAEAARESERIGQLFIPGIEITTKYDHCEIHMVGLFVDYTDDEFLNEIKKLAQTRDQRNYDMVQKLIDAGFNITHEDMDRFSGCIVTKAHVAQILVERGYADNTVDAMNQYLRKGGIAYTERVVPTPERAIELIRNAGGLAFVAHTNQIDKKDRDHSVAICRRLLELGADGLETRYCEFDQDWRDRTEALAVEYGKLRSGGSDFHGTYKKGLDLLDGYGDLNVPYSFVEAMMRQRNQ